MSVSKKLLLPSLLVPLCLLLPISAHAATVYWVGGSGTWDTSSTTHWSSSSGGASGATAPGSSDVAVFDGNSGGGTVTVGANLSVSGLSLTGATTSTIIQGANTITIGAGSYSQAGGTFTGGSATITDNSDFSLSGGTFTSTSGALFVSGTFNNSGGAFTHNSGTVLLNNTANKTLTNTNPFYNLTLNDGLVGYWKLDESSTGTSTDSSGYGNNGTDTGTTVSTSVPSAISFADSHSRSFNGANDYISSGLTPTSKSTSAISICAWANLASNPAGFTQVVGDSGTDGAIYINSSGQLFGQLNFSTAGTINTPHVSVSGGWHHFCVTWSNGNPISFYVDGSPSVHTSNITDSLGAWIGTWIGRYSGGTYFTGLIDDVRIYNRALSATEISRLAAGNEPQTGVATTTLGGPVTVAGNLTINSGTLDSSASNYSVTVSGNWTNNGGIFTPESGTVTLNGTGSSGTIQSGSQSFYNLTQNGSGSTYALNDNLSATNACTITAGTLDASSSNYNVSCGTWNNAGTFTPRSGTLTLTGTGTLSDSTSFYNLTVNGSGQTITLGHNLTSTHNLTIAAGSLDVSPSNYGVSVGGNWTNSGGTFTPRSGTVTLTGTGSQTLTSGGSSFYNLTQNGTGGTYTLQDNPTVSNSLTVNAGTLNAGSTTLTLLGTGTPLSISGTFTPATSTVSYTGGTSGVTIAPLTYNNLTVNHSSTTFALGGNTIVSGTCTTSAGTLDASSSNYSLTVGGNFTNNGTFTPRSGTVTLNGSGQSISGVNSFYNLSKSVTSTDTLTLPASASTTITHSLTFQGAQGGPLKLRSSSPGTPYTLNLTSMTNPNTQATASYVDAQDATVSLLGSYQLADTNGTDSGDNQGIVFAQAGGAIGGSGEGSGSGGGAPTPTPSPTPTPMPTPSVSLSPPSVVTPTPRPAVTPSPAPSPLPSPALSSIPSPAPATPTISELQQLIDKLKAQIQQLLRSRGFFVPTPPPPPSGPTVLGDSTIAPFNHNLKPGDTDPDVARLQEFLNSQGFLVNPNHGGPGSPGHETDFFGPATKAALIRYQEDHPGKILVPEARP